VDYMPEINGLVHGLSNHQCSVSSAHANAPDNRDRVFLWTPTNLNQLAWCKVPSNGQFTLERGWQGPNTCVLLRDDDSGSLLDWALVRRDAPVELHVPATCRLKLNVGAGTWDPAWMVELFPTNQVYPGVENWVSGGDYTEDYNEWELRELPVALDVRQRRYACWLKVGDLSLPVRLIDARATELDVKLEIPELHRVEFRVEGAVSGSLVGAALSFQVMAKPSHSISRVQTDAGGHCVVLLPKGNSLAVTVSWPRNEFEPWRSARVIGVRASADLKARACNPTRRHQGQSSGMRS
jgi:hypothetical protein